MAVSRPAVTKVCRGVDLLLIPLGYRRAGRVWRRPTEGGLLSVIDLLPTSYAAGAPQSASGVVTVLFGVWSPELAALQVEWTGKPTIDSITQSFLCTIRGSVRDPENVWLDLGADDTPARVAELIERRVLPLITPLQSFDDIVEWWQQARRLMYDPEARHLLLPAHPVDEGWGPSVSTLDDDLVAVLTAQGRTSLAQVLVDERLALDPQRRQAAREGGQQLTAFMEAMQAEGRTVTSIGADDA